MEADAVGTKREVPKSEGTLSEQTRLTSRATASRPRWTSAKAEGPQFGRSRCAGALGLSGADSIKLSLRLCTNTQGEASMNGGNSSATPVRTWQARGAGCTTSALTRYCCRMRSGGAKGPSQTVPQTMTSATEAKGSARRVLAGSARADSAGNVLASGSWTTTQLLSFTSSGTERFPPAFKGSLALIRVQLFIGGVPGASGVLRVPCSRLFVSISPGGLPWGFVVV